MVKKAPRQQEISTLNEKGEKEKYEDKIIFFPE